MQKEKSQYSIVIPAKAGIQKTIIAKKLLDPLFQGDDKKYILALAPMAGYTDSAFRIMCLEGGADLVYTEMISAEALVRGNKKTLKMLNFLPEEKNIVVQLFGKNPEAFWKATKIINDLFCHPDENQDPDFFKIISGSPASPAGRRVAARDDNKITGSIRSLDSKQPKKSLGINYKKITGIDINFGCPAHKVFKTGAGAALMDNKKIAREIIQAVLGNTKLPVSIKIRSQVKNTSAEEFINFIKDLDFKMVMVHGRNLSQGMTGEIDFEMIKKVKYLLPNKIVLGNGGVDCPEKFKEMLEKTGVDGVGIGRGALGKPEIFEKIKSNLTSSVIPLKNGIQKTIFNLNSGSRVVARDDVKQTILNHAELFLKQNDNLIPLRKHLVHYFKGQKNASEWRQKIIEVKTLKDLKKIFS